MLGICINQNLGFGIITSSDKGFNKIGCFVKIIETTNKNSKGEFDIIVQGVSRFRLIKSQLTPDGYYEGIVEEFVDHSTDPEYLLLEELKARFQELIEKIDFKLDEKFWMNLDNSELKTFKLAEKTGLNLEQQQRFIALQNEEDRIKFLLDHINKVEKFVSEKASLQRIIMNDGYLN